MHTYVYIHNYIDIYFFFSFFPYFFLILLYLIPYFLILLFIHSIIQLFYSVIFLFIICLISPLFSPSSYCFLFVSYLLNFVFINSCIFDHIFLMLCQLVIICILERQMQNSNSFKMICGREWGRNSRWAPPQWHCHLGHIPRQFKRHSKRPTWHCKRSMLRKRSQMRHTFWRSQQERISLALFWFLVLCVSWLADPFLCWSVDLLICWRWSVDFCLYLL